MRPLYTEEEKLTLISQYLASGQTKHAFSSSHGFSATTLNDWLKSYGCPDTVMIEEKLMSLDMPTDIDKLREEIASLRKEKKRLERELGREKLRSLAYNTLIDLAESTYHIKVRKNSDAK